MDFFFQPANITSQIINFGLPAPIDLQIVGRNAEANYKVAQRLARAYLAHSRARPMSTCIKSSRSPKSA